MIRMQFRHYRRRMANLVYAFGIMSLALALAFNLTGGVAQAAPAGQTAPGLGQAAPFSVIGKAGVTNTGPSVLAGNVGADSSIIGFTGPPEGTAANLVFAPEVNGPQADALSADGVLTSQAGAASAAGPNLTGVTLVAGVYSVGAALLPGLLTLDGPGVYIFLADSLTSSGSVSLINGARACDVFWHVSSGASLTSGSFVGTIIAGTSITFGDAVGLDGRAIALTGNVTLINNTIIGPTCAAVVLPAVATATSASPATATLAVALAATATSASPATATAVGAIALAAAATSGVSDPADPSNPAVIAAAGGIVAPLDLLPVTGVVDTPAASGLDFRLWLELGLVVVGLGLMLLGYVIKRD